MFLNYINVFCLVKHNYVFRITQESNKTNCQPAPSLCFWHLVNGIIVKLKKLKVDYRMKLATQLVANKKRHSA